MAKRWKERVLSFHTAEIYADMTAQYIAIGCSTSLLFFYWSHAKYELDSSRAKQSFRAPGGAVWRGGRRGLLLVALGDRGRIDFDELCKYGPFVTCVFVCMAITNVQISAIIYLRVE